MKNITNLLKQADEVIETAQALIVKCKENEESKARIERLTFEGKLSKKEIEKLKKQNELEALKLEIASHVFLKEHDFEDEFMGKVEDFLRAKLGIK